MLHPARLVIARLGSNLPPPRRAEEDEAAVAALIDRYPIGGLILFNGRWPETVDTLRRLQARSLERHGQPLLVMTDMERGLGQQLHGGLVAPHNLAFGACGDAAEALTRAFGQTAAREALACGVHVAFAPVADVNRNPRNPIIATRAFGTEPEATATLVRAYIDGARAEGLATTAKHFPGHGGTHEDSHAVTPTVADDRATLDATDLVPFRAAIDAGCDLVMTAHVAFPALDPTGTPATRSRPILTDLLRGTLGFQGLVVTDSLHMGGIRHPNRPESAQGVEMVNAGVDLLLDPLDAAALIDGLTQAVANGTLPTDRLAEAVGRLDTLVQRLTDRFGEGYFRDPATVFDATNLPLGDAHPLAHEVATRALTVVRGARPDLAPDGSGVVVGLLRPTASHLDPPEQPLAAALRAHLPAATYQTYGPDATADDLAAFEQMAREAAHVVLALVVKPSAWHAFGLRPAQHALVERLTAARPVTVVALGSPQVLTAYPQATTQVCTFSDVPASQHALAAWLKVERV